jgi:prepilin-type N-terminal cleavage/methylation domain-containing protein/prepilin-type processing-associated H-X9-DG protein
MHRKSSAFTLIELLVVIAIISMLLAIIAPSLKLAQERAQFIFCKSNLRSYGLATKTYLSDNDDIYPPSCWDVIWRRVPGVTLDCQWHDRRASPEFNSAVVPGPLWPYMDSREGHMCPTFKRFARVHGPSHPYHDINIPIEPQYAFSNNVFLGSIKTSGPYAGQPWGVKKESEVVNTADTLVWVEETIWRIDQTTEHGTVSPQWAWWVLNDTCFFSRHHQDGTRFGDFVATYHNTSLAKPDDGMGNAVFVDGSVRLLDPYERIILQGGGEARAGFIHSWPLKGKLASTMPYIP